ncbi:hypothetical protein PVAG01_03454 [Phlyctema vagabunda]|uniref:F-box domain-containing protein n=1 Tax=Phlyctema vagabunda TaxID=108571 RepID=A0ABR4PLG3_9HELO
MEVTDASLGLFSLLPVEIRIMIWKQLSPTLHVSRSLPRKPEYFSQFQGILFTSHRIQAEVAAQVPSGYNGKMMEISVSPKYDNRSWIKAKNHEGVQWDFKDVPDAISRSFRDLPWHELTVRIWFWAPSNKDRAQILCLYKKVHALVEMLREAEGFRSLKLIFAQTENTSWFDDCQPLYSIQSNEKRDYEYILPLFYQLRNVKMARAYSMEMLQGKQKNLKMHKLLAIAEAVMEMKTPYGLPKEQVTKNDKLIEEALNNLFLLVERMVDLVPSETANMLRLERFSSWYTDKLHGDSPYEEELEKCLIECCLESNGLGVWEMNDRYRIMLVHNPLSSPHRKAFPETADTIRHLRINPRGWNREIWHCVYKQGIPPLDDPKIEETYRKWCKEYDTSSTGRKFKKLHCYFNVFLNRENHASFLSTILKDLELEE